MRETLQGAAWSKYPKGYLGSLIRLRDPSSLRDRDPREARMVGVSAPFNGDPDWDRC